MDFYVRYFFPLLYHDKKKAVISFLLAGLYILSFTSNVIFGVKGE